MPDGEALERWRLRKAEYERALALFRRTDADRRERQLSEAEAAGLVQFFALTVELGWKTMAAYLRHGGVTLDITTPMTVIRAAFAARLIDDGDCWAEAVKRRNLMAHVYDVDAFNALVAGAGEEFLSAFEALAERLRSAA